jgi:hypothetical protein
MKGKLGCLIAVTCLTVTCGAPTIPSPPVQTPTPGDSTRIVSLAIAPVVGQITVGTSLPLQAMARYADNSTRTVTAQWASQPKYVALISNEGQLLALQMGLATVVATHAGIAVSAPVTVVPAATAPLEGDLSGTWTGTVDLEDCYPVFIENPLQDCRHIVGADLPIRLSLTQSGTGLTGVLAKGCFEGPVTGWRDSVGTTLLTGVLRCETTKLAEISQWTVRAFPLERRMEGAFETVEREENHSVAFKFLNRILDLRRQ